MLDSSQRTHWVLLRRNLTCIPSEYTRRRNRNRVSFWGVNGPFGKLDLGVEKRRVITMQSQRAFIAAISAIML